MAVEKKELKDVSSGVRSVYQKAQDVLQKNSLDYGIELLKDIVKREPGFLDARAALRDAEKRKTATMGAFAKFMASLKVSKYTMKAKSSMGKKPLEAMAAAEDALAIIFNSNGLNLLADAAEAEGALFIAIDALNDVLELEPKNENNLKKLANLYEEAGDGRNVLKIRQMLSNMRPDDLEAQAAVRAAAALATMEQGKWNEEGSFQDKLKSKDESINLQKDEKIVRAADDVNEMIIRLEKSVAEGDTSIDLRRKLADLYQRAERHVDAINAFNWIVEKLGTLDPNIDKAIEKSNIAIGVMNVKHLTETGAPADQIAAAKKEIVDYRLSRAEDRVNTYPNDLQMRFDLAVLYWELKMVDKALEQFQVAQRNPQRRLSAITYLGRCFQAKGQYDMAVEQFNKAIGEMLVMDKEKMTALYFLGITYESLKDEAKAMDCFKQIYSANINFMDVAKRLDAFYAKNKPQ